jgi:hypothetical protein
MVGAKWTFVKKCLDCYIYLRYWTKKCQFSDYQGDHNNLLLLFRQRPYAMLKVPVPSITEVKQHWAQSVLGLVTAYKRVNHTKDRLALLLARCGVVSHREELIQCLTTREGRIRHWFPQNGSGSPDQSPGVEECDNSITPGDWDKPLKKIKI